MKRNLRLSSLQSKRRRGLRRFRFESLERRLLLAADTLSDESLVEIHGELVGPVDDSAGIVASDGTAAEGEAGAEGEPVLDLVAVAKELTKVGVKFYGADWCPFCTDQKELFGDGGQFLPFIEVTNPDRSLNQVGIDAQITSFPTWEFPDGSRETGLVDIDTLIARSGIAAIMSETPSIAPIEDLDLFSGAPLHLALDGYDPDGDAISYTVSTTVTSGNLNLETFIPEDNTSLLVDFGNFGELTIELFEGRVPGPAGHIRQLAESGFYDGLNVHRIIENFMIQTGSPNGDGTGGSSLGDIDDQFHPDLLHTNFGAVSQAKAGDDTGDSQIFIIAEPTRFLDNNHAVLGHVKEGDYVRRAIARTAVVPNSSGEESRPLRDVTITRVTTFDDVEDAVLMLKAAEGESGTAEVTVTATDSDGNSSSETFVVTVSPDPFNGGPYLTEASTAQVFGESNTTIRFTIDEFDPEGDQPFFDAARQGTVDYTHTIDSATGEVTIDPPADFIGDLEILVGVRQLNTGTSDTQDTFDTQVITVTVLPQRPNVDLAAASDTGVSSIDNLTSRDNSSATQTLDFVVSGGLTGASVDLFIDNTLVGSAVAASDVTITTDGQFQLSNGEHIVTATQTINGLTSPVSDPITIVVDRQVGQFTSNPPSGGVANQELFYNVESSEEGSDGFSYSLSNAPTGVSLDPNSGVLTWTPTTDQIGQHQFDVVATDAAGNTLSQTLDLEVTTDALVVFGLRPTDLNGNAITSIEAGEDFLLEVTIRDVSPEANGPFAGYLDVEAVQDLVSFSAPIITSNQFPNTVTGDFSDPTFVDEAGAIAGFQATGSGELLLLTLQARAEQAGTETFAGNPGDLLPASHVLLYEDTTPVPTSQIIYNTATLEILPSAGANNDIFNFDEDSGSHSLDVLSNDVSNNGITITEVTTPSRGGTVVISAGGGGLIYTPADNAFGVETFSYTIDDGAGTDSATVTVQLQPQNDPPQGFDDSLTIGQNSTANVLDVLNNDLIAPDEGEQLTITNITNSQVGADVAIGSGGANIVYSPPSGFIGQDEIVYTFNDGNGGTSQAVATIDIIQTNDAPIANTDSLTIPEDTQNQFINVLANDSTEEGETLSITSVGASQTGGTISLNGDQIVYTPPSNFFGTDSFIYVISDGEGGRATGNVEVTVTNVNDAPVANDDTVNSSRDVTQQVLDLRINDTDIDGDTLSITGVGASAVGATVEISANGDVLYTPPTGFTGSDTFSYTVSDSEGESDTATVNVTVNEFVPSLIAGFVYFDVDNDGEFDAQERPIGAVTISLIGTDVFGNSVQLQQTTGANGRYEFTNLLPGDYVVVETQPAFLLDGRDTLGNAGGSDAVSDQFSISLEQGTSARGYNFGERGREARYIGIQSLFAVREGTGILAATDPNNGQQWYSFMDGWTDYSNASVNLSNDLQTLDLEVRDPDDSFVSLSLATGSRDRARFLGNDGDLHFIEIVGRATSYNLNGGPAGESEPPSTTTVVPQATPPQPSVPPTAANPPATPGGEGEAAPTQSAPVQNPVADTQLRDVVVAAAGLDTGDATFGSLLTTRIDVDESISTSAATTPQQYNSLLEHQRVRDEALEMYVGTGSAVRRLPDLLDRDADLDSILPAPSAEDTESSTDAVMADEDSFDELYVNNGDEEEVVDALFQG